MPLLTYHFIDTFPVNINAVPISYDGSTFLQVTAVFTYLRHTIEKHGNLQQTVRESISNQQLGQVNPIKPRRFVNEVATTSSSVEPTAPVGYVSGKPYYGPYHEMMGVKMVGAEHTSEPHPIIYDTIGESLPAGSTTGETITETNPQTETETTAGSGTSQTTETTETSGGGTTTTETTTTTTTTDSSGSTSSTTSSSSSSSSSDSSSGSSGSSYYSGYYGGY